MMKNEFDVGLKMALLPLLLTVAFCPITATAETGEDDVAVAMAEDENEQDSKSIWSGFGGQKALDAVARANEKLKQVQSSDTYKKASEIAKERGGEIVETLDQTEYVQKIAPVVGEVGGYFNNNADLTKEPPTPSARDKLSNYFGVSTAGVDDDSAYFKNQCPTNFLAGLAPILTDTSSKLKDLTYNLCFNGFAVKYSGISKTPLWSAEHLTADRLRKASNIERVNSFHSEDRVPEVHRATLTDYKGSGFDRGHLAPNADMSSEAEQYDSFSLANISPQDPTLNRNLWREIESDVRGLVYDNNEAYVVTGVVFNGAKIEQINKNVLVPTEQYKAVYIPSTNQAAAYYTPNDDSLVVELISLKELQQRTGFDVMPSLDDAVKEQVAPLTLPDYSDFDVESSSKNTSPAGLSKTKEGVGGLLQLIIDFIKSFFRFL